MSNYTMGGLSAQTSVAPITASQISQIDIGSFTLGGYDKKLPNKKISFDIHTAHGGYVVKVSKGHGVEDDMYVVGDDQDLGAEIGKIITHYTLAKE
jgi:hypothetical protein